MMSTPVLFDSHCHFDFPRFDGVRDDEWARAYQQGLRGLVIPGVRRPDWPRIASLVRPKSGIWYCLGIHPWFVDEHDESDLEQLEELLNSKPEGCLAVGECGLDALHGDLEVQELWFRLQIDIAAGHELPLVVHSVKTHDKVHGILRDKHWQGRALIHGFSGSYQQAKKLVDLGCFIGVGGVITLERAKKTRDAIARLPASALVLETDAPDMAPAGVEKGQNSPAFLPGIFQALVALKGEGEQVLADQLLANAAELYGTDSRLLAPET
ncbi:TatD family hydrolase [Marinobacter nauticus]